MLPVKYHSHLEIIYIDYCKWRIEKYNKTQNETWNIERKIKNTSIDR